MGDTASENKELSRGHKEYDASVNNIRGILDKIAPLFNVQEYYERVSKIEDTVRNEKDLKKSMPFLNFQLDYEDLIYDDYIAELKKLTDEINEKYVPFYELYLLTAKVSEVVNTNSVDLENIKEVLDDTKKIIDTINSLNTHSIKEKDALIEEAYKVVYKVILYEEIFNRSDILDYLKKLNISVNRENIGRLLAKDSKLLDDKDLRDEDLRVIKDEGLGYDYLSRNIVSQLSRKTIGEMNEEYQERKKEALDNFNIDAEKVRSEELVQSVKLERNNHEIRRFKLSKKLLHAKVISIFLIPVITFSAGKATGKSLSNQITEYKTITRSVDLNTGKVIGDVDEVYDENGTTYVATITKYTPWRKNPVGSGYIRNAVAYDSHTPYDIVEDYHITVDDLDGNVLEKYRFVEAKETLDIDDSMTQEAIVVTETYQDKSDNRKSTKYIVPFSIVGACAGIALSVSIVLFNIFGYRKTKDLLDELDEEIRSKKYDNEQIKNKLLKLKDEAIRLKKEYVDIESKYGDISNNEYYVDKNNRVLVRKKK